MDYAKTKSVPYALFWMKVADKQIKYRACDWMLYNSVLPLVWVITSIEQVEMLVVSGKK